MLKHVLLISENLLCHRASLPRLGEVADFSNSQFSTKDYKAHKETEKYGYSKEQINFQKPFLKNAEIEPTRQRL